MMWDFLFNSIWGWLGIGGTAIAAALAVAYFFPPFRKPALAVAGGIGAILAIYAKGARDAKRRADAANAKAEQSMVTKSNKDRAAAERDVDATSMSDDPYNRDNGGKVRRP